jgi:hypothetical protein
MPPPQDHGALAREDSVRAWPHVLRRGALLLAVTCQVYLAPGSSSSALADGSAGALPNSEPSPEAPTPPAGPGGPAPQASSQSTTGGPGEPAPEAPPTVVLRRRQKASASKKTKKARRRHHLTATHPRPATGAGRGSKGGAKTDKGGKDFRGGVQAPAGDAKTSKGTAPVIADHVALPPRVAAAQVGALAAELAGSAGYGRALDFYRIPLFLLPIYQAAAVQYGVPWQILAAINEVETDYGSDLSVSSAGAEGWMQFEPSTWLQYGVDAVDAGYADPYNPVDAIFAAARYLRAAGAPTDPRAAILAYNHSDAYVESVLLRAKLISSYPKAAIATLTGLTDAVLPVTGKQLAWEPLAPAGSSASATAHAKQLASRWGSGASALATPAPEFSLPPAPAAAAATVTGTAAAATTAATITATGTAGATARTPRMVDLRSARDAAVVAVREGRIIRLGRSRKLGSYVVLRDVQGDEFTYAGLGSIARGYTPPKAPPHTAGKTDRRAARAPRTLRLRVGSVVSQGTVLGRVRVPRGAKDGHLLFAIRPAGDSSSIDPAPILASWMQLHAALHPRGAIEESSDVIAVILEAAGRRAAHTARSRRAAHRAAHAASARGAAIPPLAPGGGLSARQWDALIVRIARLPAPRVAVKPSSAAIPDPKA